MSGSGCWPRRPPHAAGMLLRCGRAACGGGWSGGNPEVRPAGARRVAASLRASLRGYMGGEWGSGCTRSYDTLSKNKNESERVPSESREERL